MRFSTWMRYAWTMVLVRSSWNLFRSTIYELKLCTSYFLSAPPSELSEHSPTQHFSDWTDFLQCFIINLSQDVGRINLKPTWMEYIWVDGVRLPSGEGGGVAPPFFPLRGVGTLPTQYFHYLSDHFDKCSVMNSSKQKFKSTSSSHQGQQRSCQHHVKVMTSLSWRYYKIKSLGNSR